MYEGVYLAAAVKSPRAHWPAELQQEYEENAFNGCVGSTLVSETDRVRVWHLRLPPGKRCNFHRHQLNYFWTAHASGRARGFYNDGRIVDVDHYVGETKHFVFGEHEFFVHSVQNIGDTELLFTTVEFKDGVNPPLPVPDHVRLKTRAGSVRSHGDGS
jgi:beta-alanine degradation protein BauB